MATDDLRGRFVWHELMTDDPEAAKAFYPGVVTAWRGQPWQKDPSYTLWATPRGTSGGLMRLPEAMQDAASVWLSYIGTPDVAATVADARRLGATVLKDTGEIAGVGTYAVLADPQGAVFAVFTPSSSGSPPGAPASGDFMWHELAAADPAAAKRFYFELFGWKQTGTHDMGSMGPYDMFGLGGDSYGGIFRKRAEAPGPSSWLAYAIVDDIDKATEAARNGGGRVLNGPVEVPGGAWITQILDPTGATFAVMEVPKPAPPAAPAKKSTAAKSAETKAAGGAAPVAKTAPAKKSAARKPPAKKPAARRAAAKKSAARKSKSAARKSSARKSSRKSSKKTSVRKSAARAAARRGAAKRKSSSARGKRARRRTRVAARKPAVRKSPRRSAGRAKAGRKSARRRR